MTSCWVVGELGASRLSNGDEMCRGSEQRRAHEVEPSSTRTITDYQATSSKHTNHLRPARDGGHLSGGSSSPLLRLLILLSATLTLAVATSNAAASQTNATASDNSSLAGTQTRRGATKSLASDSKTKSATNFEQQQSSDLSSMYVQIPIAEPVDSSALGGSNPDQTQQAIEEGDSQSDSNKASTWTGPFPKKFQIGYIKQSDLHQVLMESLKNDPFLGSKKGASGAASKTATATTTGPTTTRPATTAGATKSAAQEPEPVQQQVAPPSDASSLMQPTPYAKSAAVQQVAAKLKHHQQRQPLGEAQMNLQFPLQQQQRHQQQQFHWPAGNSYGRLVTSTQMVQPRPTGALDYLGKGNLFHSNNLMMMQPHQLNHHHHHLQHQHQHQHQQQQHRALPLAQNNYRNSGGRHSARPALHHQMLAPQNQPQAFKYGSAPQMQQAITFDQQPVQFVGGGNAQSFTNQPIYTVNSNNNNNNNNFNQQPVQQTIGDQMELIQLTNNPAANRQKTKSEYVMSSWRPVQTTGGEELKQQQQQQQMNDFQQQSDSFDEEFGSPATGSSTSMNRHPVLNNFLQGSSNVPADLASPQSESNGKTSPSKRARQQSMEKSVGVKGRGFDADSVQQRQEIPDGSTKSDMNRRAAAGANNSTTAQTSPDATGANATTATTTTTSTAAPIDGVVSKTRGEGEQAASSTSSPLTTTTTATTTTTGGGSSNSMANQTTTTASNSMETTTEPDSEVFESDSTEASTDDEATTTMATTTSTSGGEMSASNGRAASTSQPTLPSPSSSTASSVEQTQAGMAGGGDLGEVTTREQQAGGSFPNLVQQSDDRTQTSTTTAASQREETTPRPMGELEMGTGSTSSTPSSLESSSGNASKTDASMSDEALMAAAVRASDLTKSSRVSVMNPMGSKRPKAMQAQNQSLPSGTKKSTRSSERLVQPGTISTSGVKGASNKLITRKPNAGQRAGKQISAGAVKGDTNANGAASRAKGKTSEKIRDGTQKSAKSKSLSAAKTSAKLTGSAASKPKTSAKITRMAPQQAQQQLAAAGQTMVSMTAAQAQSAAQTLASLLLSRCLSSSNCAHLLDVCSTKQAAVPFGAAAVANQTASPTATPASLTATSTTSLEPTTTTPASNSNWSMPVGLMSSNLMGLMQALQADRALQLFPAWRETIETIMDQEVSAGYTLIMPTNEAVDRMPSSQVDALLANSEQMSQLIENHIVDSAVTIELAPSRQTQVSAASQRQRHQTRYVRSKGLQINQHRDRMVTINGKRVVYANQPASGGRIHVIDGLLDWPGQALDPTASPSNNNNNRLLDIMETLKQCDKFDGFVTLAEGTGLTQILKQDEPLTVFVPSNEALRKIPDEELEVIKTNSTALREFIMYHIVNGSYFSQDLRDGQQLASILDRRPIQVGVRVDGCSRRLVEANTSPMRRADIAAKNGVIHILDWYLTTRDNEWCDPIGRPALQANSGAAAAPNQQDSAATSSERLQQVASEQVVAPSPTGGYATRMSSLPANHKPAAAAAAVAPPLGSEMDQTDSLVQTSATATTRLTSDQQHVPSVVIESVQ